MSGAASAALPATPRESEPGAVSVSRFVTLDGEGKRKQLMKAMSGLKATAQP